MQNSSDPKASAPIIIAELQQIIKSGGKKYYMSREERHRMSTLLTKLQNMLTNAAVSVPDQELATAERLADLQRCGAV